MKLIILFFLIINILNYTDSYAQGSNKSKIKPWLISIKHTPPFVIINENEEPQGFSIDLIKKIAKTVNPSKEFTPQFKIADDLESHLQMVKNKEADLGIAATTATPDRERALDFSMPFFSAGLGIMVRRELAASSTFSIIFSDKLLPVVIGLLLYIIIVALIIWGLERKSKTFNKGFFSGIGEAIWWTIVTMSTVGYGDYNLSRPISRVIGIFVIFSGIILFGIAIGTFSSALTINNMKNQINGPEDLVGKRVATVEKSTAISEVSSRGAVLVKCNTLSECVEKLKDNQADAIVYDMPQLKYQVMLHGSGQYMITGRQFKKEDYGIIFPLGSPLRKRVNIALLTIKEKNSEIYKSIYENWFGPMKD